MRKFFKKTTVAVAGVIVGYLLASSQGEASVTTANVKDAVVVTSEAELAEVTNAVSVTTAEEVTEQEQPALIPAKANTTRDKSISVPDETETVSTVVTTSNKVVTTQKPEQKTISVVSETTEIASTVEPVPIAEVQVTEPPVEDIPAPAPPPVPAAPIAIDDSQQAQVLDDYNAVADAAIADVLNSLDL